MVEGLDLSKLQPFSLIGYDVIVLDGDTIELVKGREKISIRLAGIDAPESAHPGKPEQAGNTLATAYLQSIVTQYRSRLQLFVVPGDTTHGRLVGVLVVGDTNINLAMVKRGLVTTYSPQGGITGVSMRKFTSAENKAYQQNLGLFQSPDFRAQFELAKSTGKTLTNVSMTDPERLANSFAARVRVGAIKGLRQADASWNSPNAFAAMKPDRPDFQGGRSIGNPDSFSTIQKMWSGKKARFLDIETTGLDPQSMVSLFGVFNPSTWSGTEHRITPSYWVGPDSNLAHISGYDQARADQLARGSLRHGAAPTRFHNGRELDWADQISALENSHMSMAMKSAQRNALALHGNTGIDIQNAVGGLLREDSDWLFIQNANFEARKLGHAIDPKHWRELLQSGRMTGSEGYRNFFAGYNWDDQLNSIHKAARMAEFSGDLSTAHKHWADWYERFSGMFNGSISSPSGMKTVDIMDIGRGVFGTAAMAGHFSGGYSGLLSQDVLGKLIGLGAETHTAGQDAHDSAIITSRLMEIGHEVKTGNVSTQTKAFFKSAQEIRGGLNEFQFLKGMANRIEGAGSVEAFRSGTYLHKDIEKTFTLDEPFYKSGVAHEGHVVNYREGREVSGDELTSIMRKRFGLENKYSTEQAQNLAWGMRDELNEANIGQVAGEFLDSAGLRSELGGNLLSNEARESTWRSTLTKSRGVLREINDSIHASSEGVSIKRASMSLFRDKAADISRLWSELSPQTKQWGLVGLGAVSALAALRGLASRRKEAQSEQVNAESYLSNRVADDIVNFRKDTSRYYPTRG